MLLIDTIYIHDGGGKVLLDYLISKLEDTEIKCSYLFDSRIKNNHPNIKSTNRVSYLNPSLWRRFIFYRRQRNSFSKVFCLGNLPPYIRMKAEVITYFHNPLYLKTPKEFTLVEQFKYKLKRLVLERLVSNTDLWLVQTDFVKQELDKIINTRTSNVSLMPFFPPFEEFNKQIVREEHSFLFVSNAYVYKNHGKLISAFCAFFDEHKVGKLILTVSKEYKQVINIIEKRIAQGYPIVNVGFVCREDLKALYLSSQFLIYPSLAETFGLGLVEAINNGCKVLGADLAYTYAICEPSIVFDPYKVNSIIDAFEQALDEDIKMSKSLINDEIFGLVELLK